MGMNQPGQGGQMPPPPPSGSGMPSWTNNITARGTMAGPAGVALADFTDRAIAAFIDFLILGIVGVMDIVQGRCVRRVLIPLHQRGKSLWLATAAEQDQLVFFCGGNIHKRTYPIGYLARQ